MKRADTQQQELSSGQDEAGSEPGLVKEEEEEQRVTQGAEPGFGPICSGKVGPTSDRLRTPVPQRSSDGSRGEGERADTSLPCFCSDRKRREPNMAAPLQRFGRLTSLKAPWSILRSGTAAEFCTKSGDGKAGKTQEQARSAPDLTVPYSKTSVSFPSRPSGALASCLPDPDVTQVLNEAEPAPVMAASDDGPDASSPSSSSSDSSSSDSESDDEESSVGNQAEVEKEPVEQLPMDVQGVSGRNATPSSSSELAAERLLDPGATLCADSPHGFEAAEDTPENTPSPYQRSKTKASAAPTSSSAVSATDRVDASRAGGQGEVSVGGDLTDVSSTPKHADPLQAKTSVEALGPDACVDASSFDGPVEAPGRGACADASSFDGPVEAPGPDACADASSFDGPVEAPGPGACADASSFDGPVEAPGPGACADASSFDGPVEAPGPGAPLKHIPSQHQGSPQPLTVDASSDEAPAEGTRTEELSDAAPAVAAAEAEGAAAAEPQEPFDNSTYKNLQHHSYTPYTFADLDLEMAQYRLPQPSSGRPSPRH
ncbi:uncharacterized protein ndufv3 isoform X2 [Synchiropus splendidus]|uniref:uncharacterized protein ndufv3 isoform X2 n=1 Tax=Synchiropus splendidus TaxID=270530 RepID=UPI00237E1523|nr:uncharacterized protein ndufv3 isoform X2 [Synchiropus splendidus]